MANVREQDRFLIRQRVRLVRNRYEISLPGADGKSEGELVGFVEQKVAALKEDLRAYTDQTRTSELFRIKARRVFDPAARYKVTDPQGAEIGELGKHFARSLARSTWHIYSPDGREIAWAQERSLLRALLRRVIDVASVIPLVGELIALLPIRYHFDIFVGGQLVGSLERVFSLRDRYVLDLAGDGERLIDRRLALALAVGMDAMQAR